MLTFQEIINSSPFFHADIIGGWKGKERSFLKVEEYNIQSNDPILLVLPNNASTVIQLTEYLSIQNVQGVLLYGNESTFIPSTVIEMIDTFHKPVLILKEETSPISIKKILTDLEQLKTMGLYHYIYERSTNYWLQFINEEGLDGLLNRLCLFLDQDLFLLNEDFDLHPSNEDHLNNAQIKNLKSLFYQQITNSTETLSMVSDAHDNYLLFPLRSGESSYGFILLQEQPGMMIDVCIEQVTHAIPAIISYLKKEEAVSQAHQSYKKDFLYNLLYNNLESEQLLIKQGKQWGWDFTKPTQLMVMRLNPKNEKAKTNIDYESIMRKIRSLISANFLQTITFPIQGNIVIIIFDSFNHLSKKRKELTISLAQRIHKEIEHSQPDFEYQIGIGRYYPSNMELFRSFYEAKVALELGKYEFKQSAVRHFEDIGITRLLSNIHNNILHEYYEEILGELIFLDKENGDFHMETLETFYNNNSDINQTAEQLFIHPNTLRKRLKKIESILNIDLNQIDDLLNIFVALKVMKMLK